MHLSIYFHRSYLVAQRLALTPTLSCIVKEPGGMQKRKWRITLMRHVRRLQRKSVSQGILSLGLHDVISYVRYDGGFTLTRAAVSSAMPRISSRAFLCLTILIHTAESNFFDIISRGTYQWPLIGGQILSRLDNSRLLSSPWFIAVYRMPQKCYSKFGYRFAYGS